MAWDIMELRGITQNVHYNGTGYHGFDTEQRGMTWNSIQNNVMTWDITESHGITWNTMQYNGVGYHGIAWKNIQYNGMEYSGIVGNHMEKHTL